MPALLLNLEYGKTVCNFLNARIVTIIIEIKKKQKNQLTISCLHNIIINASRESDATTANVGVWLSLARAPGLGPGGRRFESCHPDTAIAGVVQW